MRDVVGIGGGGGGVNEARCSEDGGVKEARCRLLTNYIFIAVFISIENVCKDDMRANNDIILAQ